MFNGNEIICDFCAKSCDMHAKVFRNTHCRDLMLHMYYKMLLSQCFEPKSIPFVMKFVRKPLMLTSRKNEHVGFQLGAARRVFGKPVSSLVIATFTSPDLGKG